MGQSLGAKGCMESDGVRRRMAKPRKWAIPV